MLHTINYDGNEVMGIEFSGSFNSLPALQVILETINGISEYIDEVHYNYDTGSFETGQDYVCYYFTVVFGRMEDKRFYFKNKYQAEKERAKLLEVWHKSRLEYINENRN